MLNQAITAFQTGDNEGARRDCRKVLAAMPGHATSLILLGAATNGLAWLGRAACVSPDDPALHNTSGNLLLADGSPERAAAAYRRAIVLAPDLAHAHYNLGNLIAVHSGGRLVERQLCRATAVNPAFADAWASLANAPGRDGIANRSDARRALAIMPTHGVGWAALGITEQLLSGAAASVTANLRALAAHPSDPSAWTNLKIAMQYDDGLSSERRFALIRRWGAMIEAGCPAAKRPVAAQPLDRRRLRVGYLSADLRAHVIPHNIEGLLAHHDTMAVEIFLYAEVKAPDDVSRRLARHGSWRSTVGRSDADVADLIRSDRIDILVCLAGHTAGNRLSILAHRPAPVQLSFHDVSTSGLTAVDGWITDHVLHPPDTGERFTETLLRLPTFYLQMPRDPSPDVLPSPFLSHGYITFGSFNSVAKLSDDVFDVWSRILAAVPNSRLAIGHRNQLADGGVAARVVSRLLRDGMARERVSIIAEAVSSEAHLARLSTIDIALDAFPFNGSTTTFECLWMGVPVVTVPGERFVSRVGASLLTAIGEDRLIADSVDRYVEIAVELAHDRERLVELRQTLRPRVRLSRLCDAPAYARAVEELYREAWRRWAR